MIRTTRSLALLAAVASAAALAACDGSPNDDGTTPVPAVPCSAASAKPTTSVLLSGMQFLPYCATVSVGVALTFTNADSVNHTVTADAGQPEPFDCGLLYPGQQFTHTFSKAETVRVHDRLNPEMAGLVIVQ